VSERILHLWRTAQAVCFDVDSTVTMHEGLDVLARYKGHGREIEMITARAMNGEIPFEDTLKERLKLLRPSRNDIEQCMIKHPFRLSPGIAELVAALHVRQKVVYLVSGGFSDMIAPIARKLGITDNHLITNKFLFHADGSYAGYDTNAYTSRMGGKSRALQHLKNTFHYAPLIMVGDGSNDLEAKPPADAVIGYGGVAVREKVKKESDWFVHDFHELIKALA
jgi:phosphoserine phosphatase